MKKYIFTVAFFATTLLAMNSTAQTFSKCSRKQDGEKESISHTILKPHLNVKPCRHSSVNVSYDDSSTLLAVNFPSNTEGGTVEVFCNGSKVAGITTGGSTTFSCILKNYGEGDYDIIVSRGNTVVYSRNVIVR